MEETRWGGGPHGEVWIAEEDSVSSDKEEWLSLWAGTEGTHFRMAQEEDNELQSIRETEVAQVEEEII